MPRLDFTQQALRDLDRLRAFLLQVDGPASAARADQVIRDGLLLLLQQPRIGRSTPERPSVREWTIRFGRAAYRVTYRFRDDVVTVARLQHSREEKRDI